MIRRLASPRTESIEPELDCLDQHKTGVGSSLGNVKPLWDSISRGLSAVWALGVGTWASSLLVNFGPDASAPLPFPHLDLFKMSLSCHCG